jgi:chromosome condensin MukBEF ATPase and DNA-binding subunit MukB
MLKNMRKYIGLERKVNDGSDGWNKEKSNLLENAGWDRIQTT